VSSDDVCDAVKALSIPVDSRHRLWNVAVVDGAWHLIGQMQVVQTAPKAAGFGNRT
jgi:hypothetical protein